MTDQVIGTPMDDFQAIELEDPYYSDEAIAARHKALRGTDALLYYPPHRACHMLCGREDNDMGTKDHPYYTHHQCFYGPDHVGRCKFSSECEAMVEIAGVSDSGMGAIAALATAYMEAYDVNVNTTLRDAN